MAATPVRPTRTGWPPTPAPGPRSCASTASTLGESLGTGVVTRLATTDPPAALVLRSPYTALVDVGARTYPFLPVRTMLRDRYPLLELMPTIQAPVTVIRGTDDHIVPTFMSEQVARAAPHLTEDLVLEAGHNDVAMFGPSVARAVIRAVEATR